MKDKELDNILDDCLERLRRGETVAACLAAYPEQAEALKPLLETAGRAQGAMDIKPRPEFRQSAAAEFAKAVREIPAAEKHGFSFGLRPAWVTLIAVVIVLAAGGGTVGVASSSLPDSPLYSVKMAAESVQLALTFSDEGKTELYANFADERIDEIVQMAAAGKAGEVERATARLDDQLLAMSDLTAPTHAKDNAILESGGSFLVGSSSESQEPSSPTTEAPQVSTPPATTTPQVVTRAPDTNAPEAEALNQLALSNLAAGDEDSLLNTVSRQALENSQALHASLAGAPESVWGALLAAIQVADAGYLRVLLNLE